MSTISSLCCWPELTADDEHAGDEATERAERRHDAEEHVAARAGHPAQLGECVRCAIQHIGEWAAEAHDRVEHAVGEHRQVADVEQRARARPTSRGLPSATRSVLSSSCTGERSPTCTCAPSSHERDREEARARTGVEDDVAGLHVLRQVRAVHRDARARCWRSVVSLPLLVAVRVVVARRVLRVVSQWHRVSVRTPATTNPWIFRAATVSR